MRADVAVVGGGPAGCFVGGILAERGFDVVIIEEHAEVGNPVCCTGIVSVSGLRELGIKPGNWALGKLRRAVVYPPSNEPIEMTRGRVEALVVDRAEFDRSLAREAARAGAKFFFKSRCTGVKLSGEPLLDIKGVQGGQLRSRLVIGADGPASIIAQKAGLIRSRKFLRGAQMEVLADIPDDVAEVYFGRSFAPGFFGWLVRAGEVTRAGICCSIGNPLRMLRNFIEKHPIVSKKLSRDKIINLSVGPIPESWSRKICADHLMLVGDAAGHVKPLTGGGIYIGLSCARMAAEVAVRALEGEPNQKVLQAYERLVEERFGEEFRLGLRARRVLEQMSDEEVNAVLGLLMKGDIRELVLKNFDFDSPGRLVGTLAPEMPRILKELGIKRALKYARYLMAS
jgi:geranylgeranyl reductase family protein